jgi:hypothetical protein
MLNKDNEFEIWEYRGWSKIKNLVDCIDVRIMSMRHRFQQISALLIVVFSLVVKSLALLIGPQIIVAYTPNHFTFSPHLTCRLAAIHDHLDHHGGYE